MKVLISLLLLLPAMAYSQIKVATGLPISGDSSVSSAEGTTKLEQNHWLKVDDLVKTDKNGVFQVLLGKEAFESYGESSVKVLSSKDLDILQGCLTGGLGAESENSIGNGAIRVLSGKESKAFVCSFPDKLFVLSFSGELTLKNKDLVLGTVKKGTYLVYFYRRETLTSPRRLSPLQMAELENGKKDQEKEGLNALVPYGLSGKIVANENGVLLNEMILLDSSAKKFDLNLSQPIPGGERLNLQTGEISLPYFESYYDPHEELRYSVFEEGRNVVPARPKERPFFYREGIRKEVTGGVRGLFDPQRLDGVSR